jgi:hypothetical protein
MEGKLRARCCSLNSNDLIIWIEMVDIPGIRPTCNELLKLLFRCRAIRTDKGYNEYALARFLNCDIGQLLLHSVKLRNSKRILCLNAEPRRNLRRVIAELLCFRALLFFVQKHLLFIKITVHAFA